MDFQKHPLWLRYLHCRENVTELRQWAESSIREDNALARKLLERAVVEETKAWDEFYTTFVLEQEEEM